MWSSGLVIVVRDRFPVAPGHTLVMPLRHVATYFDATPWEQAELWRGVADLKKLLDGTHRPDGYNVGVNAGDAAGQTVMHRHIHVIPRAVGDMDDPRGGRPRRHPRQTEVRGQALPIPCPAGGAVVVVVAVFVLDDPAFADLCARAGGAPGAGAATGAADRLAL